MLARGLWVHRPHSTPSFFPVSAIPSVSSRSRLGTFSTRQQPHRIGPTSHMLVGPPPFSLAAIMDDDGRWVRSDCCLVGGKGTAFWRR